MAAPVPTPTATRFVGRLLVVAYGAAVASGLLLPNGWAINRFFVAVYLVGLRAGVRGLAPEDYASMANVVLFAPLAYGLVVGWPRVRAWLIAACLVALSASAEVAQRLLGRDPSVRDVLLNSVGVVLGTALGAWWVKVSQRSARLTS